MQPVGDYFDRLKSNALSRARSEDGINRAITGFKTELASIIANPSSSSFHFKQLLDKVRDRIWLVEDGSSVDPRLKNMVGDIYLQFAKLVQSRVDSAQGRAKLNLSVQAYDLIHTSLGYLLQSADILLSEFCAPIDNDSYRFSDAAAPWQRSKSGHKVTELFLHKADALNIVDALESRLSYGQIDMDVVVKTVNIIMDLSVSLKQLDAQEVGKVVNGQLEQTQSQLESHILAIPLMITQRMANFPIEVGVSQWFASLPEHMQAAANQWL